MEIFTRAQLTFIEWLITPPEHRKYKTQKDLAEVLGVSEQVLSKWKQLPQFETAIAVATVQWSAKQLPSVMHALIESAQSPTKDGAKDREIIFKHLLPNLDKLQNQEIISILKPVDGKKLKQADVHTVLESMPREAQPHLVEALTQLGYLQQSQEETAQDDDLFTVEVTPSEQIIEGAIIPYIQAQQPVTQAEAQTHAKRYNPATAKDRFKKKKSGPYRNL